MALYYLDVKRRYPRRPQANGDTESVLHPGNITPYLPPWTEIIVLFYTCLNPFIHWCGCSWKMSWHVNVPNTFSSRPSHFLWWTNINTGWTCYKKFRFILVAIKLCFARKKNMSTILCFVYIFKTIQPKWWRFELMAKNVASSVPTSCPHHKKMRRFGQQLKRSGKY